MSLNITYHTPGPGRRCAGGVTLSGAKVSSYQGVQCTCPHPRGNLHGICHIGSGVARGGGGGAGPRAQALEGAPAQLQRRSQVSLAGGGGLTEFQGGGGDKPQYL